jgi:predicted ester cyclase
MDKPNMSDDAKTLYRTFVEEVINKGDYDRIPEIFAEDYLDHNAPPGAPTGGYDAIKAVPMMFRGAFPDVHFTIEDMISQDGWVATRVTGNATHLGKPFMSIEPTGLRVSWSSMGFFRVAKGRIVEHYGQPDLAALHSQLTREIKPGTLDYNRFIISRYVYATNIGELDRFDEYVDPGFVDHNAIPGQKPGIEGLKDAYRMFSSAFSDLWYTFEDLIAEGDKVCGRGVIEGKHTGNFMGVPATNRVVRWTGTRTFKLANGKVTDGWIDLDMYGLLMQLGVIPVPAQA